MQFYIFFILFQSNKSAIFKFPPFILMAAAGVLDLNVENDFEVDEAGDGKFFPFRAVY